MSSYPVALAIAALAIGYIAFCIGVAHGRAKVMKYLVQEVQDILKESGQKAEGK
jgi:hypothetical protein